ncbi:MAG: PucR family transcriptional regulator [Eubacteriales bacterium]|nr:PucR family transcriptional regulator [Eubacteriales bacterium]
MKITVDDCLALDVFVKGTLAAGKKHSNNRVKSISVMDSSDLEEIKKENGVKDQMVLTSFHGLEGQEDKIVKIIKLLAEQKVAALVVFHKSEEKVTTSGIIDAAEDAGLPLIIMSDSVDGYADVIDGVMNRILYNDSFDNDLINNTIFHLLNFERHTSFETALKEAAIKNEFQVIMLSKDFNPVLVVETRKNATVEDAIKLGKKKEFDNSGIYTFIEVNGVVTYWGPVKVGGERYYLMIVDNNDNYSAAEITKLAQIIELAMGMWKYTPERDVKSEFIKALIRDNKSLAYSLKDEMKLDPAEILSVFYAKGIETDACEEIINNFEEREGFEIVRVSDGDETNGIIISSGTLSKENAGAKLACIGLYDELKEENKRVRIFQATGVNGIEGAGDAFRLIYETWTFVETVFPYKRVFSKYDLTLVSNCINIQVQGGYLKKNFVQLLSPFDKDLGENKAKQLLDTLETFVLDAGMNSSKTSQFMGIHTNTVQYRLKRINEILGAEITANRVVPALTMALALKRLERVIK